MGADFARELAGYGCNLVLTARREDRLEALKEEITSNSGVSVEVIPADLSKLETPQELYDQIKVAGISIDVLVNNAGFGIYGAFLNTDWQREHELIQLNVTALVHLTKLFLPGMVARGFGYILQMASNSAYQPTPYYSTYGGSKSFVLSFSEALNFELRGTGVSSTAFSPGTVATEFHQVTGQRVGDFYYRLTKMESSRVARMGIKAMLKRRSSAVVDWKIALMAWFSQRAPRSLATASVGWLMRVE